MKAKKILFLFLIISSFLCIHSQTVSIDEIKELYKNGDYKTLLERANSIKMENLSFEDALELKFYLGISYIRTGSVREGIKLLEEYYNKKDNIEKPDVLIELYKAYKKSGIKNKEKFYRRILFNHFPYNEEVIKLKISYCREILLNRNWSEALMYLIDLDDKGFSKMYPEVLLLIAEAYYFKETFTISADYYRKYIKATGRAIFSSPKDIYYSGEAFYNTLNYNDALKMFLYYINVYPKGDYYPDALLKIGDIFFNQKKYFLAVVFYREFEIRFTKHPKYYLSKLKIADSVKYLNQRELLKLHIPYDYKNPIKIYLEVIKKSSELELIHLAFRKLLNFSQKKGKLETALWYLHDYLKKKIVDPEGEKLYRSYFNVFISKNRPSKVVDYFLTIKKSYAFLGKKELMLLAKKFNEGGFFTLERETLNFLLTVELSDKKKAELLRLILINYALTEDWDGFERKLKEYRKFVGKKPYPDELKPYILEFYFKKGDYKLYRLYFEAYKNLKSVKQNKKYTLYYVISLYNLADYRQAEKVIVSIMKGKIPEEIKEDVFKIYVLVEEKLLKYREAERILKFMIRLNYYSDWAYFKYGKLLYLEGRKKEAERVFSELKKLYPQSFWTSQVDVIINEEDGKQG